MNQTILKSGLLLASLLAIAGCKNDSSNNNNNNGTPKVCTADTKECVDSKHLRICSTEGSEWYNVTCDADETCDAGACKKDEPPETPLIVCFPGDGKCMPGTPDKSLLCNSTGTGFNATDCPTGTACVGGGVCVGVCAVGSSTCLDGKTVATCTNGTGYTTTTCTASEACVITGDSPFDTAACKASECQPALDGCDFVCGNKTDSSADQTKFVSICIETTNGWKWTALGCAANEVCDSQGGNTCAGGLKAEAACAAECSDGDSFCTGIGTRVVCTNGTYGAPIDCADGKFCFGDPKNSNAALCGDEVCALGDGTCLADGTLRSCDATGNLVATGAACATGLCVQVNVTSEGLPAGKCIDVCKDGETQCVGEAGVSITFKTCVMGRWAALENCTSGLCYAAPSSDGRLSTICGECQPQSGECGDFDADDRRPVRFCAANGTWGDFTDCTLGTCVVSGDSAACVAQCVPGSKVCMGDSVDSLYVATEADGTCTSFGLRPDTSTQCTGNRTCRIDVGGNVLGCVECVYNNEHGLVDSECRNDDEDIRFCTPSNTWAAATACGDGKYCNGALGPAYDAPVVFVAPAPVGREYCHACELDLGNSTVVLTECRESALAKYGTNCNTLFDDSNAYGDFCLGRFSATTLHDDCCYYACFEDTAADNLPLPASCFID